MTQELLHPIFHYLNGERLYYITLSFERDALKYGEEILEIIKEQKLERSTCAHYIFGDWDLLIRMWVDELRLRKFLYSINKSQNIHKRRILLIERQVTWYQARIEKKPESTTFSSQSIEGALAGNFDKAFSCTYRKNNKKETTRFWVFVEESFSTNSNLYDRLRSELDTERKAGTRFNAHKPSVYSYNTKTSRGVIIKAESDEFIESCGKIADLISRLAKDSDFKVSTYIQHKALKEEEDWMSNGNIDTLPIESRKNEIIYNLVKSHDCYKYMYPEHSDERRFIDAFCNTMSDDFDKMFLHTRDWNTRIKKLRVVFKWIVEQKNPSLISFFLREYVLLERAIRKCLAAFYDDEKDEINGFNSAVKELVKRHDIDQELAITILQGMKKEFTNRVTLGEVPTTIHRALKVFDIGKNSSDEIKLKELSKKIAACAKDRNKLAHGEVTNLFESDSDNKIWLWQEYSKNFFDLYFNYPKKHIESMLKSNFSTENRRKTQR